jgi:ubiquinone/menaquinone biosynthesis C-methylase UbiE
MFSQREDKGNRLLDVLLKHVSFTGKTIFEMGCGTGKYTEMLAPYCEKWYANDISPLMIEQTQERCADLKNISYITASAENSGLPDHSVDLVFAAWAFPNNDLDLNLKIDKEFDRILKKDGSIWIWNNYLEGEFNEMRGLETTHEPPGYLKEHGYRLVEAVKVYFEFKDLKEAKYICSFIFGDNANEFFDRKGIPVMEDMVSILTRDKSAESYLPNKKG